MAQLTWLCVNGCRMLPLVGQEMGGPRLSQGILMASRELEWIRNAILDGRYTLTEHAYDEMEEDHLDVLDVESAVLTGTIDKVLTVDPRGTRFVIVGNATDQETPVAVVVRFVEQDQLLIITVYEIK